MGRTPGLVIAAYLAFGPGILSAQEQQAPTAIGAVIRDQIAAFQRDDLDAAFAHASPSIQSKFGTAEVFGQMVARGYPMIWRPARYAIGELAEDSRGPVQTVTFVDETGTAYEADYLMERVDGVWRIDGVTLRRLPGTTS